MTKEEALKKVQKLMEMTVVNGATEAEAASALAMAQRIMCKFNISDAEISADNEPDSIVDMEMSEDTKGLSSNKEMLSAALAKHYRCRLFKRRNRIHVVGTGIDAEICIKAIETAYSAFKNCSAKLIKDLSDRSSKIRAKNTYLLGFIRGLVSALEENENSLALVLVVPQGVNDYMDSLSLRPGQSRSKSYSDNYNYSNQGYVDGYHAFRENNKQIG